MATSLRDYVFDKTIDSGKAIINGKLEMCKTEVVAMVNRCPVSIIFKRQLLVQLAKREINERRCNAGKTFDHKTVQHSFLVIN